MIEEFKIKGMHCNSCANTIEKALKDKVKNIMVSYSQEKATIDFDETKISKKEITEEIKKQGYSVHDEGQTSAHEFHAKKADGSKWGFEGYILAGSIVLSIIFMLYALSQLSIFSNIQVPQLGEKASLLLIFAAGLLTGFHCVSMCGGFVVSYTAKNALAGHKGFKQHLVYGGAKTLSYAMIGGIFGLIGGIFSFSTKLRGTIAVLAGIFMVFYALSMLGVGFFRRFQLNPKFLTAIASKSHSGPFKGPMITGLLNGLFLACGPLQAMYLYATGTGGFVNGAISLGVFGLGTLPVMMGFGSLTTVISHKTTGKILKVSAIIVLILGLITINRGLSLTGSALSLPSFGGPGSTEGSTIVNGVQEINMDVLASGWNPNVFTLKKGVPAKWNINVKELTGCNNEIIVNDYGLDVRLRQGLNVVEFTPDKTGTVKWSCGMGMLRGSFIVTEDGQATQNQINTATAASKGGSCGGSGGGCGCGGGAR